MKRRDGWVLCVAAVMVLGGTGTVRGQAKETSETTTARATKEEGLETRTYNVADLVRTTPDYPFESEVKPPTGWDQGGRNGAQDVFAAKGDKKGKAPATAQAKPGIEIADLISVIEGNVDPGTWRDNGGTQGTIQMLGSLLVVTQTPANQQKVNLLLGMIYREYGPLKAVGVSVRWVLLTPERATQLVGGQKGAVAVVDEKALGKLSGEELWAAGRTACFSGQTVFVASGRGRTVVTKANPVVGTNAGLYDVTSDLIQSGAVMQVTPALSPDGQTAVLDLASVVTDWGGMEGALALSGFMGEGGATTRPTATIDRVNVGVQQMRTTVRVPIGKAVVVGGMTREPGTDGKQLYLIAEVTAGE